jgi:hypothetical protein
MASRSTPATTAVGGSGSESRACASSRAIGSERLTSDVATYSGGSGSPPRPIAARKASRRSRPTPFRTPRAPSPTASGGPT